MITIELDIVFYKSKNVITLKFLFNKELVATTRKLPEVTYSNKLNAWYFPYTENNKALLIKAFDKKAKLNFIKTEAEEKQVVSDLKIKEATLKPETIQLVEKFRSVMYSKRYSQSTVDNYSGSLLFFFRYYAHKKVSEITNDDIVDFNNNYILQKNYSATFQNQFVNALKLFYRTIENKAIEVDLIQRPKQPKVLPNVLSKEEVKELLDVIQNVKHKAMLSLIYSCGLRSGELIKLRLEHVDSKRNLLIIKAAKGQKDRIAPLSTKTIKMLRDYYQLFKPQTYLFEAQTEGAMYDSRSLQKVLKQNLAKTKIKKPVTLHWLRHSYATHLLENGTDLRYIQEILGHNSSRTTEIYTHVSTRSIQNVVSPFDML